MSSWPAPREMDIVWCKFPYGGQPVGNRHPCLVLGIAHSTAGGPISVLVAGGTSASKDGTWVRVLQPTDFVLQQLDALKSAGLSNRTAFQFEGIMVDQSGTMTGGTLMTLPYTDEYFVAVAPATTPVVGRLDLKKASVLEALVAAGKAANLKKLIALEEKRNAANPDPKTILKVKP